MNTETDATRLAFPGVFPITAFGCSRPDFDGLIAEIVRHHGPNLSESTVIAHCNPAESARQSP